MRLSPKSIFLGLVALGLPFAVTVGWQFAGPSPAPARFSAPVGAGGIGAAPKRATPPTPLTVVDWTPPAATSAAGSAARSTAPPVVTATTVARSSPSTAPRMSLPALTLPPVPTPTEITNPPPSPSATSSSSAAPESGLTAARLVGRP